MHRNSMYIEFEMFPIKISTLILLTVLMLSVSCKPLPGKKLYQFSLNATYKLEGDSLKIDISNILACPLRLNAWSKSEIIDEVLDEDFPMIYPAFTDTSFSYYVGAMEQDFKIHFPSTYGDTAQEILDKKIAYPFPKGNEVLIIQAYNGAYSHNSDYSRYALDFELFVGDTITAVADAWVIGVIDGYMYGGKDRKWRPYSNFITLYHPESHIYTQYVHLKHKGSFVDVGDFVKKGQPIGLCGLTGFTDREHLHFNVLRPSKDGMESMKIEFENGVKGEDLKRGMKVKH
ncbi:MAG: M23 family metallopeptidase [Bacteroidota bacterium]